MGGRTERLEQRRSGSGTTRRALSEAWVEREMCTAPAPTEKHPAHEHAMVVTFDRDGAGISPLQWRGGEAVGSDAGALVRWCPSAFRVGGRSSGNSATAMATSGFLGSGAKVKLSSLSLAVRLTHGEGVDHGRGEASERARETLGAEDADEHGEHGHLPRLAREGNDQPRDRVAVLGLLLDAGRDLGRLRDFSLDLIVRESLNARLGRVQGVDEPGVLAWVIRTGQLRSTRQSRSEQTQFAEEAAFRPRAMHASASSLPPLAKTLTH